MAEYEFVDIAEMSRFLHAAVGVPCDPISRRFDLTTFQEPLDALVAVGSHHPGPVILDIRMPGVGGILLLERLRTVEITAHIRVVVPERTIS